MLSSYFGHLTTTGLLLDLGAEIDLQNDDGDTALLLAVKRGHTEVANELRSRGADEKIQNKKGETALNMLLLYAAASEDQHNVARLLQQGADALARNMNDNTGLHISAKNGNDILVKIFIDNGCDINSRGSREGIGTPLMLSSFFGHLTTTRLLLDLGADDCC